MTNRSLCHPLLLVPAILAVQVGLAVPASAQVYRHPRLHSVRRGAIRNIHAARVVARRHARLERRFIRRHR